MTETGPFTGQIVWIGHETGPRLVGITPRLYIGISEEQAMAWIEEKASQPGWERRVWKATLDRVIPQKLVTPAKRYLADDDAAK